MIIQNDYYYFSYAKSIDMSDACLMGGIYGVNLQLWREKDIHKEILYWMTEHQRRTLWSLGTQPLLMIIGYKRVKIVSYKWNLTGLGWYTKYTVEQINRWHILHWNGKSDYCYDIIMIINCCYNTFIRKTVVKRWSLSRDLESIYS